MSGICGIINFNGALVDPVVLEKMAQAAAYRGPDGIHYWIDGSVGLAHLTLHTTPESLRERQPLHNTRGDLTLVADARIDNRGELIPFLASKGLVHEKDADGNTPTDADLILAAYECWGEDCPKRLIGDFAFVIWNAKEQMLFAARDPVGIRQLHYHQVGPRLLLGTSIASILAVLDERPAINRPLVEDMLASRFDRWVHETGFVGIYRLPPSYTVAWREGQERLTRYWFFGAQAGPKYKSDDEYVAHYRDLFEQAVRAHLRSAFPIGITGGAGLDSGSILGMANHLIAAGGGCPPVRLYTGIFDHTPGADEREYLETSIAANPHIEPVLLPCDDYWALRRFPEDIDYPLDDLDYSPTDQMTMRILRRAVKDGARIVLTGIFGDQMLLWAAYHLPDCIPSVPLKELPCELPHFVKQTNYTSFQLLLAYAYLSLPLPLRSFASLARQALTRSSSTSSPRRLQQRYNENYLAPPPQLSYAASHIYHSLSAGPFSTHFFAQDKLTAYLGIEWRYPYLHRSLVDFLLSIPARLFFQGGTTRRIQRKAMQNILPELIYQRNNKAFFDALYHRGVRDKESLWIDSLFENAVVVHDGFLDKQRLELEWTAYKSGASDNARLIINTVCVEAWLRSL